MCTYMEYYSTDLSFPSVVECIISHEEDNSSESPFRTTGTAVPPTDNFLTRNNLESVYTMSVLA